MGHWATPRMLKNLQHECKRKVRHETRDSAVRAIGQVADKGKIIGTVEPYPCDVCGGWHWGKSPWSAA